MPIVEVPRLTSREEAEERAENFRIDDVPVEIVKNPDGTFTVRATYPDDAAVAQPATNSGPANSAPPPSGGTLKLSSKGAALIKHFESCKEPVPGGFKAYNDPVGVLTIGWGHTNHHGTKFDQNSVWTQGQCDAEFLSDMVGFEAAVHRLVNVPLNQDQFDALVSFAYNCGEGNLEISTLRKKLNAGDFAGAANEFPRWNKAKGKVLAGLTRRRASEALLFRGIPDSNYDGVPD
jgi:lysozyme